MRCEQTRQLYFVIETITIFCVFRILRVHRNVLAASAQRQGMATKWYGESNVGNFRSLFEVLVPHVGCACQQTECVSSDWKHQDEVYNFG